MHGPTPLSPHARSMCRHAHKPVDQWARSGQLATAYAHTAPRRVTGPVDGRAIAARGTATTRATAEREPKSPRTSSMRVLFRRRERNSRLDPPRRATFPWPFICMDLAYRQRHDLAARLLYRHLKIAGDFQGSSVLRSCRIQHALERCKVALLRSCALARDAGAMRRERGRAGSERSTALLSIFARSGAQVLNGDIDHAWLRGQGESTWRVNSNGMRGTMRTDWQPSKMQVGGLPGAAPRERVSLESSAIPPYGS